MIQRWGQTKPLPGAQLNLAHPLARGLVGCWPFLEGSGDRVYDLSGNGNVGTKASDVSWTLSEIGHGLQFDSDTEGVNIPFSSSLAFGGNDPITIYQIINGSGAANNDTCFSQAGEIMLRCKDDAGLKIEFILNSFTTNDRLTSVSSWPSGFAHIAGMYDGADMTIWLNGRLDASITPTGTYGNKTDDFGIGGIIGFPLYGFNASVISTYFYARALTPAEVQQLYISPFAMFDQRRQFWAVGFKIPIFDRYYKNRRIA